METNEQRVDNLIVNEFCFDRTEIEPVADLRNDLGLDSLNHIEMIMALEDEFNINISDKKADGIKTVQDVYNLINDHPSL